MFAAPPAGPIGFGDLFSADWLFDVHLREGSTPLRKLDPTPKGLDQAFAPARRSDARWLLSYGRLSPAVIVDDDCHIEGVLEGRAGEPLGGRLHLVAIRAANDLEMQTTSHFSLLPVPDPPQGVLPPKGFKQVVVDFNRSMSVQVKDSAEAQRFKALRVANPTDEGREELLVRWSACSTRRGPIVATDASDKLARLLKSAGYDDSRPVAAALGELLGGVWVLEGATEDAIGAALEKGADPEQLLGEIERVYDQIERLVGQARQGLAVTRGSAPAGARDHGGDARDGRR